MPDGNGSPSVTELARRIARLESLADERIVTTDMLRASEKLYEARELSHVAAQQALEYRIKSLEEARGRLTTLLIAAILGVIGQAIILVLTIATRSPG